MILRSTIVFTIAILFSSNTFASQFSDLAWSRIGPTLNRIIEHPFNQKLASGELPKKAFDFYQSQDALYLVKFSRALLILSEKLENTVDKKLIKKFAEDCLSEIQTDQSASYDGATPSNVAYTSYILAVAAYGTKEELIAALLPCYWIYLEVADRLKPESFPKNPYWTWIQSYSSDSYRKDVKEIKELTDRLASKASKSLRAKMLTAFRIASELEFGFWDDSYHLRTLLQDGNYPK